MSKILSSEVGNVNPAETTERDLMDLIADQWAAHLEQEAEDARWDAMAEEAAIEAAWDRACEMGHSPY